MLNVTSFGNSPAKLNFRHVNNLLSLRPKPENTNHYLPLCSSLKNTTHTTLLLNSNEDFPGELQRELMPQHVAFIMDGNRRWAKRQGLSTKTGHEAGYKSSSEITRLCANWGIKVATFYFFSTENWNRSKEEVDSIMWLMERFLVEHVDIFNRQGIRLSTIGDISKLPKSLQQVILNSQEVTKDNTKMNVIHAINYSGKQDLVQACQRIATQVGDGLVGVNDINENLLEQQLETNKLITCLPSPDLLIRTSGELRISNFLLWQLAYAEFYFTDTLWPDFHQPEFAKALQSFQTRVHLEENKAGIGVVGRRNDGRVLFATAKPLLGLWNPELVEALAARKAMELAVSLGYRHLIIEGDCLNVIKELQSQSMGAHLLASLVDDCYYLRSAFESIFFNFCFRECNGVAHRIASWATSSISGESWNMDGPSWIADIVASDIIGFNSA